MAGLSKWALILILMLFAALLITGCGDDDDDDDDDDNNQADDDDISDDDTVDDDDDIPDEYEESCQGGPELTFDLSSTPMVVPYPNNLYRVPDHDSPTNYRVRIDGDTALPMGRIGGIGFFSFVVDAANTLNGFSTLADQYLPVGDKPDHHTFPPEFNPSFADSIFIMLDDPEHPNNGEFIPVEARLLNGIIHVRPQYALRENAHYVLVATRALEPAEGNCYSASADMIKVWEAWAGGAKGGDYGRYADSLANLWDLGFDTMNILSISEYNTQWFSKGLDDARKLVDELIAANPPEFKNWELADNGQPHPHLSSYAFADLAVPVLQNNNGIWERDGNGDLIVQGYQDVTVLFSLPTTDASPEGQPYPLSMYGHGLGDTMQSLTAIADKWAEGGFAMAGMDNVCHGFRAPIELDPITSLLCYFRFLDPLVFMDNIRETHMNLMYFAGAIKSLADVDMIPPGGDGIPDFDVDNTYWTSISLGSIQGGTLAALEDNIKGFAMSSAGAKWTGIALEGPYMGGFVDIAKLIDNILPDFNAEELLWLVGNLAQHILDTSDSANFMPRIFENQFEGMETREPWILQQGASEDFMIGGVSGAYYCRAGGWPQVNPFAWDVGYVDHVALPYIGSGFYQFDTEEHFGLWEDAPIGDATRKQALHYLRTVHLDGEGEIIPPWE